MNSKRTVVVGLLGPSLDSGIGPARWERWRPSVAACQHEDLLIHRFELLHSLKFARLAGTVAADIRSVSPETEVRETLVEIDDPWDFEEVYGALHAYARSRSFVPEKEDYLVHITTGSHVAQICLFLLTESRHLPGRLLQTSPPPRRGSQSPGGFEVIDLDLSRYDKLAARFREEARDAVSFLKGGIETRSEPFNRLIERIEQVAIASRSPILLTGPTGAGKSLLARRIFDLKKARGLVEGEFVDLNCATLRGDAAMSALFGHVKGAFTGAVQDRPGLLRKADGGLLFLDEIGELGHDEQAMLLRALEEKVFLPLGSDREARSEFQLIAGTNSDLGQAVAAGRFRDDLLARINLWTFRLPGLRERLEDIEPNLQYELESYARLSGARVTFSKEARERFLRFAASAEAAWRGNFRDLNAAVTRMATLAPGGRITMDVVEEEIGRLRALWSPPEPRGAGGSGPAGLLVERTVGAQGARKLDLFDRLQLEGVLEVCRRSRSLSEAGRELFQVSRLDKKSANDADRLRKYLARVGLEWDEVNR